ncbi:GRB2-associated-binding protein 1 isoform X4 [Electrophorus electricus]|uniref:GRB2-associated-binding protein 1 isoform X4 n=1 Tax=Electrophorus electricus TaxID=8005 RepID=UPI0015D03735|nr:GRB2-associated-binding protein 1 isoform X4 [Electrophorus electricus]
MSGGDVVCSGWLRKSPPEKKLRRYAWKKRWFVLRSGRLTGDPDVLEYYKNDHVKKPIRVIDLNLCEQVDAGLTFNKKDLEHSFIFDIKTIDRVFYLVADSEEEMNKWVRCICDICGFNPTDTDGRIRLHADSAKASHQAAVTGALVVDMAPHAGGMGHSALTPMPPPYQPVSVRHLESSSSLDDTQDYLLLLHCESKKPEPGSPVTLSQRDMEQEYLLLEECESKSAPPDSLAHGDCRKSTSSEPDCNDNLPSHRTAKHGPLNGFFPSQHTGLYDSPPSRGASLSMDAQGLYHLPRSYSQDTVLLPKSASSPPGPDSDPGDVYVFNIPVRKPSLEAQFRNLSVSYDIPPTPGSNCTYQVPRAAGAEAAAGVPSDVVPPPRPPKPSLGAPVGPPDRSPTDTYAVPRSVSEADANYCVPSGGNKALRSNTIGTVDSTRLRKDYGSSQDCYDIPRSFPSDRNCSFEFNENFNNYFKNKGLMPLGTASTEEMDENYVPMSANSPSHHRSGSLSEPIQEPNYVPMTPGTVEFPSLGKQVPPPAHMGFRSSPKTPPRRPMLITDCQPPPVDRNLKPDRKGQSPKLTRVNRPVGLERTDSQTVGEFSRRRKVKPAPLDIKPVPECEEFTTPVRSPVTRSFARDPSRFPVPPRPPSVHSTASSTDSEDCDENYVAMQHANMSADEPNLKLSAPMNTDGGSSPMVKPKGDKQVEYLDLDLDPGKSTPPRMKKSIGTGAAVSDERVDYVVVDQQRTQALKSTREAWSDGRQSTESDTPSKGTK